MPNRRLKQTGRKRKPSTGVPRVSNKKQKVIKNKVNALQLYDTITELECAYGSYTLHLMAEIESAEKYELLVDKELSPAVTSKRRLDNDCWNDSPDEVEGEREPSVSCQEIAPFVNLKRGAHIPDISSEELISSPFAINSPLPFTSTPLLKAPVSLSRVLSPCRFAPIASSEEELMSEEEKTDLQNEIKEVLRKQFDGEEEIADGEEGNVSGANEVDNEEQNSVGMVRTDGSRSSVTRDRNKENNESLTVDGTAEFSESSSAHITKVYASSGYWNISSGLGTGHRRDALGVRSVNASKNFSMREDYESVAPPFYLENFPWTEEYSLHRDGKKELLFVCSQKEILTWKSARKEMNLSGAWKLGEGTFGEVFCVTMGDNEVALKVIPINGEMEVNGEAQKSFEHILPEVIVSRELSQLRCCHNGNRTEGFIRLVGSRVVRGCYPKELLAAWRSYKESGESLNDDPKMFKSTQHFLLLAYENGGTDLEKYKVDSIQQAYSIIYQVMVALAVADYELSFEHRDLHCGNVLISKCSPDESVEQLLNYHSVRIATHGARARIIDFTLSRMRKGTSTIFYDCASDEELFNGEGDLQFDVYRLMRKANRNDWEAFNPRTNLMWIVYLTHYICRILRENSVASKEEIDGFMRHFQVLHKYEDDAVFRFLLERSQRCSPVIATVEFSEES